MKKSWENKIFIIEKPSGVNLKEEGEIFQKIWGGYTISQKPGNYLQNYLTNI